MIKFNLIRNIAFIGLILFSVASCDQEDYLETVDKSRLTDATMWASEGNADIYLNDCYSELPAKSNQPDNLDNFTDDNDAGFYYTSYNWKKGIVEKSGGANTSVWGGTGGPDQYEGWGSLYNKVRKVNNFILKITENKANYSEGWYNKRMDEARFLRAYFYSEQFVKLGGLVILTEPQDRLTMEETEMLLPRSTFEQTLKFMVDELTSIISNGYLPVKYNNGNANAGRATLGAASMIKGWVQLFAASPAYNSASPAVPNEAGNKDMQSFATPDPARWAAAAATFKHFIDTYGHKGSADYRLFSPMSAFWYEANEYNSEVIWDRQHVMTTMANTFDTYGGPVWIHGTYYTWGNYCPTQELVDDYQMANGLDIDDAVVQVENLPAPVQLVALVQRVHLEELHHFVAVDVERLHHDRAEVHRLDGHREPLGGRKDDARSREPYLWKLVLHGDLEPNGERDAGSGLRGHARLDGHRFRGLQGRGCEQPHHVAHDGQAHVVAPRDAHEAREVLQRPQRIGEDHLDHPVLAVGNAGAQHREGTE